MKQKEWWILFLVPLAVRLGLMAVVDSPGDVEGLSPWQWGHEPACIAASLERGDGYADPFLRGTGPTGWLPPAYPALLALLMRFFGGVTSAAAGSLYAVQSLVSAAACPLLAAIGARMKLPRVGRIAAWCYALHPMAVWYAIHNVWDTILVATGLAAFVWLTFRSGRAPRPGRAAWLGAAFGALLLINPAPMTILPVALLYVAPGGSWKLLAGRASAFLAAMFVVLAPWMARNQMVLGSPNLRSNLGVELNVGNNDLADGWHRWEHHPGWTDAETVRLKAMGEAQYSRTVGGEAMEWIRADLGRFLMLSLERARLFWLAEIPTRDERTFKGVSAADDPKSWVRWGLHMVIGVLGLLGAFALAWRSAEGLFLAGVVLLFPAPYYVMHVLERYRFPIDPLLILLGAYVAFGWLDRKGPLTTQRARVEGS